MYGPLIIRKVGNSLTVMISDIAKDLGLGEGRKLFAMRTPRGVELTPYYRVFEKALDTARDFMRKYLNVIKTLAE